MASRVSGGHLLKTFLIVLVAVTIGGTGHVLLSKGMRTIGDMTEAGPGMLGPMALRAVTNHWVMLGVALQATFFCVYLMLLSRAKITQVLPMTAMDYVVVALLAQAILGETVSLARWAGIGFVTVGVLLISRT
jgi:drug/metabolite transporter (DMT)-like permease